MSTSRIEWEQLKKALEGQNGTFKRVESGDIQIVMENGNVLSIYDAWNVWYNGLSVGHSPCE